MHGHGDSAQTSCGFAVPSFDYQEDRKDLVYWTNKISDEGFKTTGKKKSRPVLAVNLPKYYEELTLSFYLLTPL
jgi:hypothetical protein